MSLVERAKTKETRIRRDFRGQEEPQKSEARRFPALQKRWQNNGRDAQIERMIEE